MRSRARLLWVLPLWVFPIGGCNEVTTPTTAPLTLAVFEAPAPGEDHIRLEGVQLCETDTTNCTLSDARGEVTIELPIDERSSYTIEKERYGSWLVGEVMQAEGEEYDFGLATNQRWTEQYERVMSPYPMRFTGSIVLQTEVPLAGATFELVDATGKAFYYDGEGRWSPDLTATTSDGAGGFFEVSPGVFQVNLGGTAQRCVPTLGWPNDVLNSVIVPVQEGYISYAFLICPPPP